MAIEDFQKVADLLLKSVAATAIAAGWLFGSLNKNKLDQGSICLSMSEKLYAPADSSITLERRQKRMSLLIDKYSEACGKLTENETEFLMNSLLPTQAAVVEKPGDDPRVLGHGLDTDGFDNIERTAPADLGVSGWVAIGRIDGSFGQVNFDGAQDILRRPLLKMAENVLKARWSVNVRENTSNTKLGTNKVLSVLEAGDCIQSGPLEEVRGQVWTLGKVVNCN
jgi:hypothetical protein